MADAAALGVPAQEAAVRAELKRSEPQMRAGRTEALLTRFDGSQPGRMNPQRANDAAQEPTGQQPAARALPAGTVRLLDHVPELAVDLTAAERPVAHRMLTVPSIALTAGPFELAACQQDPRVVGRLFGLVIIEGVLVREVSIGGGRSTSLHGPGDLLDLQSDTDSSFNAHPAVMCHDDALVAILDDHALAAMQRFPRIIARLFTLTMRQLDRADTSAAISKLERVEDRLLALFCQIADRSGRRGHEGITIDQRLTHEAIGRLIGARRPTVSLGLQALAEQRLLQRQSDGSWLLTPDSLPASEARSDPTRGETG